MNEGATDCLKIEKTIVPIEKFKCPVCGSFHPSEKEAINCGSKGMMIAHINAILKESSFFICDNRLYAILDLSITRQGRNCLDTDYSLYFLDSNGGLPINHFNYFKELLKAEPISISIAVEKHGWRVFSKRLWEERAKPEMSAEYEKAIKLQIAKMSEEEKNSIVFEAIAYKQKI